MKMFSLTLDGLSLFTRSGQGEHLVQGSSWFKFKLFRIFSNFLISTFKCEHESMEPQTDVFYRAQHVSFCSWDISYRTNKKTYVDLTRWPGSKQTALHSQCDICVFILASTESFKVGCLCLRRINWQRQLLEITREGPCLGVRSWICSHVMNHSKLLLCQAVLSLFLWLQCCSLSQDCLQIRILAACLQVQISASMAQWVDLHHSVPTTLLTDTSQSFNCFTPLWQWEIFQWDSLMSRSCHSP